MKRALLIPLMLTLTSPIWAAGRSQRPPVRVELPCADFTAEVARAVQGRLESLDTIRDAAAGRQGIGFTVRPGESVRLSSITAIVEEVRGADSQARVVVERIALTGTVQITIDGLTEEETRALAEAMGRQQALRDIHVDGAGELTLTILSARGARVEDLNELIADALSGDRKAQDSDDDGCITDICWSAPDGPAAGGGSLCAGCQNGCDGSSSCGESGCSCPTCGGETDLSGGEGEGGGDDGGGGGEGDGEGGGDGDEGGEGGGGDGCGGGG